MHSILYRNKQDRKNVIKVIIEDKVLEQFGVEKVKQKIKSLRKICGAGNMRRETKQDARFVRSDPFSTATSRRLGYLPEALPV